ncbi:hypothetical protein [Pseudohaliea rubra]|uniref:NADH:quinone oxidoreductase/Mrp antiporter membrane subunit domain-containing protein n=1 Tax=Pseudohaliea rubra DSM 19751 TaxID=1265313 RepID=A0A095VQ04_9GAMM|nr:hypothetical protein [Pseudohaliea rubra]KGE03465.1 hypothetical protein HRUBRA_01844 [Pseudohaliea rubra DSM 19751]
MSLLTLVVFAPLLLLPLLPLLCGRPRQWLVPLVALLPVALLLPAQPLALPWILLGSGVAGGGPGAAVVSLVSVFFALALAPWGKGAGLSPRVSACLLLAQAACIAALVATDLMLLLAGFTVASYALLAARLSSGALAPGRLPAIVLLLVPGDLAAFELALLFAKVADNAVTPSVAGAAAVLPGATVIAGFAALAAASRGALLLLVARRPGQLLPTATLVLLVVPTLGWRLGDAAGALSAVLAVAAGAAATAALSRLWPPLAARFTQARERVSWRLLLWQGLDAGAWPGRLAGAERELGSWRFALAGAIVLVLLLLIATFF